MAKSSKRWCQRQASDFYVKSAKRDGYLSRAAYKLLEIDEKYSLFHKNDFVIDLGAAPGSWSQVASAIVGERRVIALDRLETKLPSGIQVIQGDFTEQAVLDELLALLGGRQATVVLSDMAPNLSGQWVVDIPKSLHLVDLALDLSHQVLAEGGALLCKVFQGAGLDEWVADLRKSFKRVRIIKPKSSRSVSRESYVLATGYNKYNI